MPSLPPFTSVPPRAPDAPARPGPHAPAAALAVALVAAGALLGWVTGTRLLLTWGGGPTMKAGTAVALLACAGAVLALRAPAPPRRARLLARTACGLGALWGITVLAEWVLGASLGIDEVLVQDTFSPAAGGRPAPLSAGALVLLAGALGTTDAARPSTRGVHAGLLTLAFGVVTLAIVARLFDSSVLNGHSHVTGMALPTLAALAALLLAIVLLRPGRPPAAWASGSGSAATLLRRLGPAATLVPLAVGVVHIAGEEAGLYDARFGAALATTTMILALTLLVVLTAGTVERRDASVLAVQRRLRQVFEAAPDALVLADGDGIIRDLNTQAERLFEYPRAELIGRPVELLIPVAHREAHAGHRAGFAGAPSGRPMGAGLDLRARRRDGTEVPVEISLSPMETEEGLLVAAAIRDVTERIRDGAEQAALKRVATAIAQEADAPAVFGLVAAEAAGVLGGAVGLVARFEAGAASVVGAWAADGVAVPASGAVVPVDARSRLVVPGGLSAPVHVGGEPWGAVAVAPGPDERLPEDGAVRVERFAALVSIAIANAQAWETLARHATIDVVSGLPNRRTFHARLREECARARRYGRPLSVVLFDLDEFKRVNDTFGHHTGDRVLAEAARRLASVARHGELVARVGGEEFAWLQPETDALGAFAAAERARRAIEGAPFDGVGRVTVSAGVCSLEDGRDPELLLQRADRALYWAKDAGRNATFRYTDEADAALAAQGPAEPRRQTLSSVRALARAIDAKDFSTHRHSERVANLAELLALRLGWTTKRARLLHDAALLHDVGKIGIADSILLKPGPLSGAEYDEVKRHAAIGATIVAEVLEEEPTRWVRHHHERWNGSGYPDALAGDTIPDGAQILALADAWDVMTTARAYQQALSLPAAREECLRQRGLQFAPDVVDALLALAPAELDALRGDGVTG